MVKKTIIKKTVVLVICYTLVFFYFMSVFGEISEFLENIVVDFNREKANIVTMFIYIITYLGMHLYIGSITAYWYTDSLKKKLQPINEKHTAEKYLNKEKCVLTYEEIIPYRSENKK